MPRRGRRSKLRAPEPVGAPALLSNERGTPVAPIRRLEFRLNTKVGRFMPAPSGTLVLPVDGRGRPVMARYEDVFGETVQVGWELAHESGLLKSEDVRFWLEGQARRRRSPRTAVPR